MQIIEKTDTSIREAQAKAARYKSEMRDKLLSLTAETELAIPYTSNLQMKTLRTLAHYHARKNGLKVKTVHSADDLMLYVSLRVDSKASYKRR